MYTAPVTVDRDGAGYPLLARDNVVLSDANHEVVCTVPLSDAQHRASPPGQGPDFSAIDVEAIEHAEGLAQQLTAWPLVTAALQVLVLDAKTRAYLQANDPKALQQATAALDAAGLQSAPALMATPQGPVDVSAYVPSHEPGCDIWDGKPCSCSPYAHE